jgi:hypothetical protein
VVLPAVALQWQQLQSSLQPALLHLCSCQRLLAAHVGDGQRLRCLHGTLVPLHCWPALLRCVLHVPCRQLHQLLLEARHRSALLLQQLHVLVCAGAVEAVAYSCCSPGSPGHQPLLKQLLPAGIPGLKQQLVKIMEACKQVEQQRSGQQWQQAQAAASLQMVGCVKTPAAEQHPATMTATRALSIMNVRAGWQHCWSSCHNWRATTTSTTVTWLLALQQ